MAIKGTIAERALVERARVVAQLRAQAPRLRARGVSSLSLFGSMARGEAGPESNLDRLIEVGLGSYQSAWHMAHRVRHAMSTEPLRGMLASRVEVDETYVGGKPRPGNNEPRKTGRGTSKTPVVALVERSGLVGGVPD